LHFLSPFIHHFYLLLSHNIFIYCIIASHKIYFLKEINRTLEKDEENFLYF
jgi:hypothetical protein